MAVEYVTITHPTYTNYKMHISKTFNQDEPFKYTVSGNTGTMPQGTISYHSNSTRTSPYYSVQSECTEITIDNSIALDSYTEWYPTVRLACYVVSAGERFTIGICCRGVNEAGNTFDATYHITRTRGAYDCSITGSSTQSAHYNVSTEGYFTYLPSTISGIDCFPIMTSSSASGDLWIDTTLPVFPDYTTAELFIKNGGEDYTDCLNVGGNNFDLETKLYYIYNKKGQANLFYGNVTETSGTPVWRCMRFYANARPCFYMTDDTGFAMSLMASRIVSSIGVAGPPYYIDYINESEWREGELYYTDGFYGDIDKYKKSFAKVPTNGVYTYGLTCDTNIPVFANQEDAEEYLENPEDEDALSKSLNYGDISQFYNPTNPTGEADTGTEFGQVYTRGFFSRQYILNQTGLAEISNNLFSVGTGSVWETLKKGIELYGDTPFESVQSCIYYPVALDSMFSGGIGSTNSVFFGSYQMVLENSIAYQISFPNGHFDLGTFTLRRRYNNWRDYEPYCRCYLYLPYCGTFQLDLARYYNKVTTIRYFVDTRSGSCIACLVAGASSTGGHLIDYFNGQMGVQMPITMTDFSRYANNQISTLLGGVQGEKPILQNMTSTLGMLSQAGTGGAGVPMAIGAGAIATMANASKTMYDLTQNNINSYNKTVGGSTSMLNEYLPQRATFLFEYQEAIDSPNELLLQGLPSNASGMLANFSGYLEVESINLVCPIATENEKRSIINQLKAGVIL